ncbi:unnamed protein product [Prorocentrum cordatum]|uniref:Copper transporter n=1 Tax=Prorocentrum cordatum TaxID=2364126 RepID=A0ABN9WY39_9DINO|nr:unnamed protein product [Polarella glacialis]
MNIKLSGTSSTKADGTSNQPLARQRTSWKEDLHLVGGHAYLELVVVGLLLLEACELLLILKGLLKGDRGGGRSVKGTRRSRLQHGTNDQRGKRSRAHDGR